MCELTRAEKIQQAEDAIHARDRVEEIDRTPHLAYWGTCRRAD